MPIQFEWWKEMTKMKDKHSQWLNIEKQQRTNKKTQKKNNYEEHTLKHSHWLHLRCICRIKIRQIKRKNTLIETWLSLVRWRKKIIFRNTIKFFILRFRLAIVKIYASIVNIWRVLKSVEQWTHFTCALLLCAKFFFLPFSLSILMAHRLAATFQN